MVPQAVDPVKMTVGLVRACLKGKFAYHLLTDSLADFTINWGEEGVLHPGTDTNELAEVLIYLCGGVVLA